MTFQFSNQSSSWSSHIFRIFMFSWSYQPFMIIHYCWCTLRQKCEDLKVLVVRIPELLVDEFSVLLWQLGGCFWFPIRALPIEDGIRSCWFIYILIFRIWRNSYEYPIGELQNVEFIGGFMYNFLSLFDHKFINFASISKFHKSLTLWFVKSNLSFSYYWSFIW